MSKVTFGEESSRFQHQQNVILSFEKRLVALEKMNAAQDKQIEGLKNVCKLQQQFTETWEQECAEMRDCVAKAMTKFKQL